ncbi:FixH family protein [Paremcibacter congregatus]|jgi:nitrogen fixation protein FixH|uniref:FixH family protein n=1 Tax=Paremcibacter congregatus TaxID=2043170 RepID=UPI0030EBF7F4|tara:strand:+ start:5950 stop:6459 length:510 start_codon:yes stop_codon:yes gene_type:complete
MTASPDKPVKPFTGKKALLWFVGFFLIVFTVNGIMAYIALGTWGGLETDNAYRKGLHYNDAIAASEAQAASGWTIDLAYSPQSLTGDRLDVQVTWPEGDLPPAKVIAQISRAVTDIHDQEITLTKSGDQLYSSPLTLPAAGQWNISVLVFRPEGAIYQMRDKIFIQAQK